MITFKEYLSEEHKVGDRISWYYNKFHPRYAGKITKQDGDHFVVKSEGDGQFYRIHKSAINQYGKPDAKF